MPIVEPKAPHVHIRPSLGIDPKSAAFHPSGEAEAGLREVQTNWAETEWLANVERHDGVLLGSWFGDYLIAASSGIPFFPWVRRRSVAAVGGSTFDRSANSMCRCSHSVRMSCARHTAASRMKADKLQPLRAAAQLSSSKPGADRRIGTTRRPSGVRVSASVRGRVDGEPASKRRRAGAGVGFGCAASAARITVSEAWIMVSASEAEDEGGTGVSVEAVEGAVLVVI